MNDIKIGSLFSGIGGIENGLERTGGFETTWFVEREPFCQEVLRKHWPKSLIYSDITKIDWERMLKVDVLTGGFPCQDISNAGKRKGIGGERSGLWKEYLKAIGVLRPKVVFAENVAALLGRGLNVVLCDLAEIGYDAEWHCLPASSLGAPHRRDRVFIIAYPNNRHEPRRSLCSRREEFEMRSTSDSDSQRFSARDDNWQERQVYSTSIRQVAEGESERSGRKPGLNQNGDVDMANSNSFGHVHRELEEQSNQGEFKAQPGSDPGCATLANAQGSRWSQHLQSESRRLKEHREVKGSEQWQAESDVGRMVDGVSKGLDNYLWRERIKSLGNAVVPQCAEFFGSRIKEIISEELE